MMDTIINTIKTIPSAQRTFLFTLGFLLTFIVLSYIYILSNNKDNAERKNKQGLLSMTFIFFFYIIIGIIYIISISEQIEPRSYLFLLSGFVNICFVMTIPFFSQGTTNLDRWSNHRLWNYLAIFLGLIYISFSFIIQNSQNLSYIDVPITTLIMIIIGVFVAWDFERRDMKFFGYLIAALLLVKMILQISTPSFKAGEDKFDHVNMTILFPAMIEAIIAITISFSWINGLRYKKLAKLYSSDTNESAVQKFFDKAGSIDELKDDWKNKIIKNDLEGAIQSMVLFLEKRNEHFEIILSIASRNNRNNTGQLKGILSVEQYNITRNKILDDLLKLIQKV